MERRRDERGQATNEYAALLALVAVVMAGLAGLTSSGIGGDVLAGMRRGLCVVASGACPTTPAPRTELAACPVERRVREERLSETIASVRLGTSGTLTAARRSDGRVTVTIADGSSAGLEGGLGFTVLGRGVDAEATADAVWTEGRSWTFPSAAEAQRFVDRYGDKATMKGQLVDQVRSRCSLLCDALGWRPHPHLPPPDETYAEAGGMGELTAPFGLGGGEGRGGAAARALLGLRTARGGERTWYVQLDAKASAELGLPGGTAAGGAGGEAVLSYRLDASGRPLELGVHVVAEGEGRAALKGAARRGRGSGEAGGSEHRGGVVETEVTLDLTDADNLAAATGVLDAIRGDLLATPARVRDLAQRIEERGQVDVRRYALESDGKEIGAELSLGLKVGGSFSRSSKGLRLVEALTRLPGLPFLPRDDCRAA